MTPIFTFDQFLALLGTYGPAGLVATVLILVVVYIGKFTNLLPSGDWRRVANVALGFLFGVVSFPEEGGALVTVIASTLSTLAHFVIEAIVAKLSEKKA